MKVSKFKKTSMITMGLLSLVNAGIPTARAADLPLNWHPSPRKAPAVTGPVTSESGKGVGDVCKSIQALPLEQQIVFLRENPKCLPHSGSSSADPTSSPTAAPINPTEPPIEPTNPTEPPIEPTNPTEPPAEPTEPT